MEVYTVKKIRCLLGLHNYSDWFVETDAQYETYDRWETKICTCCGKKTTRSGEHIKLDYDDVYGVENLAHVPTDMVKHQSYTKKENTKQLICTSCGSTIFEVGVDDYFTSVRCCRCKIETEVHSG